MEYERQLFLFCDESDKKGRFFSNFFGGVLVGASQHARITKMLADEKARLRLEHEVKWSRTTEPYLGKYREFVSAFFREIRAGHIKARVMFTQNSHTIDSVHTEHEDGFFKLYYQLIKHAFGLRFLPPRAEAVSLQLFFDMLPDTREKVARFKGFIHALQLSSEFRRVPIRIAERDIQEVDSKKHPILQALDVVLGAMSFRLNDKHLELNPETGKRGNRTKAKEALYKHILSEIRSLRPGFNPGISTGKSGDFESLWKHPYRHWLLISNQRE